MANGAGEPLPSLSASSSASSGDESGGKAVGDTANGVRINRTTQGGDIALAGHFTTSVPFIVG